MTNRAASGRGGAGGAVDRAVLLRLRHAAWRAMPQLAVLGLAPVVALVLGVMALGRLSVMTLPAVALVLTPLLARAIASLHGELFEAAAPNPRRRLRAFAVTGPLAVAASCAMVAAASTSSFQGVAAAATTASLIVSIAATAALVLVGAIALPLADMRPEVSLRSVWWGSAATVVRRPLAAVAAVLVPAALAWLAASWFLGLLVAVAPAFAVLSVAATWTSVAAAGIAVPAVASPSSEGWRPTPRALPATK